MTIQKMKYEERRPPMPNTPNPGSDQAIDQGCICAVLDNNHGRGYMGREGVFVMRGDCPMHGAGTPEWDALEATDGTR